MKKELILLAEAIVKAVEKSFLSLFENKEIKGGNASPVVTKIGRAHV